VISRFSWFPSFAIAKDAIDRKGVLNSIETINEDKWSNNSPEHRLGEKINACCLGNPSFLRVSQLTVGLRTS
jgi:hypothetical protein